jgi:hypothetical protein
MQEVDIYVGNFNTPKALRGLWVLFGYRHGNFVELELHRII